MKTFTIFIPLLCLSYLAFSQEKMLASDSTVIICVESGNGDPITQIDLAPFENMLLYNVHYNDDQCIEMNVSNFYFSFTIPGNWFNLEKTISGINIEDMFLLQDHVLGNRTLDYIPKLIAADCTRDDRISAADKVKIHHLILGKNYEIYWRLLDKNKLDSTLFGIEADLTISPFDLKRDFDLILVKTGDINFSQFAGEAYSGELLLKVEDQILNRGENYSIPFIVQEETDLRAFQVEFKQDDMIIDQFTSSDFISPGNYSSPEDEFDDKTVIIKFSDFEVHKLIPGDTFFILNFRAMENGILSEMLTFHSDENNLAVMPVGQLPKKIILDWKEKIINTNVYEPELEKITLFPNPASEFLEIKGISSKIKYQINDLLGKVCDIGNIMEDTRLDVNHLNNGMYVLTIEDAFGARKAFKFFMAK